VKTVALVPAKAFTEAKSRLAPELPAHRRAALAARLLAHVLDAILASDAVDVCGVVSPDPAVLAQARLWGAVPVAQERQGLNPGLEEGRAWAIARGAQALLIVLGDLPLLTPADVAALVTLAAPRTVVLAPDRHGTGSNALLLAPPGLLPFHFGPDSAARHTAAARRRGLALRRYESAGTAFDIDTPADLAAWLPSDVPLPLGGSL
jgi:2-phospho-L-lactate guanylyltransferase